MSIPTRRDIVRTDGDLDAEWACKNYLGKTVDEAAAMFRENPLHYEEDLFWMGPVAFRYYVEAAIRYVVSDAARNDSVLISAFLGTLEHRAKDDPDELKPMARRLAAVCRYVVERWSKFNGEGFLREGVRRRYATLAAKFRELGDS